MKKGIVVKDKNNFVGTIVYSLYKSGYDIVDFNDNLQSYTHLVVFFNKLPPKLNTSAKIAWWMNDFRPPEIIDEDLNTHARNFDMIFLCQTQSINDYEKYFRVPCFYMPQVGIDDEKQFSIPQVRSSKLLDFDVLFLGGITHPLYHVDRQEYVDLIKTEFNIQVISNEKHTTDQCFLYKNTPINLSISLPYKLMTSNRLYNILSSGGFALVKYFPKIELLFENKKHLVWFETKKEMMNLIAHYLLFTEERKEIAKQGKLLYANKHTSKNRADNMFDIMIGVEKQFRGFLNYKK